MDGADAMLRLARLAVHAAGFADRISLVAARIPSKHLPRSAFDVVLSNSLLHHLPEPNALWRSIATSGRLGAAVLVMDLRRPASEARAQAIVDAYAADEPSRAGVTDRARVGQTDPSITVSGEAQRSCDRSRSAGRPK